MQRCPWALFTQEHRATSINTNDRTHCGQCMGEFTQHCKQHQRVCLQTCTQMCFRVLCELGLGHLAGVIQAGVNFRQRGSDWIFRDILWIKHFCTMNEAAWRFCLRQRDTELRVLAFKHSKKCKQQKRGHAHKGKTLWFRRAQPQG